MEGVFEIIEKDGAGRVGELYTKHGVIETPAFLPVLNPHLPLISPSDLKKIGFEAFITNAYTLWKDEKLHELAIRKGIHGTYNWDGPIMTDSGAYQLMVYKDVEVSNLEIMEFQKKIGVDIGVPLDVPIAKGSYETRKWGIQETYNRALEAEKAGFLNQDDIIWVGPIHGAPIPDLVDYSTRLMKQLPFKMYAMGSVVPLMEDYRYIQLVKSALVAKKSLYSNVPIHMFGAGHPAALSLFVLLGFDTFDSASYALFARDDRYFTAHGSYNLNNLKHFPCDCPVCSTYTPQEIRSMDPAERAHFLAMHHLYVIQAEIRRIKQAIYEGSLWQLVSKRVNAHPELARAYRWLLSIRNRKSFDYFELYEPTYKRRGLLITRREELNLPIIRRYKRRILERVYPWSDKLILATSNSAAELPPLIGAQVVILHPTFGAIPREIRHVYPLFQHISYLDDVMLLKSVKRHRTLIEKLIEKMNEEKKIREIYAYDKDMDTAKNIADILEIDNIYKGEEIGFVNKDENETTIVKALVRYQYGKNAEKIVRKPHLEYSRKTGLLRKIYDGEISPEEEENVIIPELEKHMERRGRKGLETPEEPFQELYVEKGKRWLLAALLPNAFKLVPHPLFGYRFIKQFGDELRYMLIIDEEAEPFVRDGKTIFSKFVLDIDDQIRSEDEIFVVNQEREIVAIAKAILGAKEIKEFKRGAAAKNRWGFKLRE
ncbi:MAG: tRNA guanosine(15) transglycosylase TgtA [Candidatus Njordarchaeia archaeon]